MNNSNNFATHIKIQQSPKFATFLLSSSLPSILLVYKVFFFIFFVLHRYRFSGSFRTIYVDKKEEEKQEVNDQKRPLG